MFLCWNKTSSVDRFSNEKFERKNNALNLKENEQEQIPF